MVNQTQKIGPDPYRIFIGEIERIEAAELRQAFLGLEGQKRTINLT